MDKLHFLTAGIPMSAKDYTDAFEKLDEKERQIAETGWMLIGELASHKKAKGR